uniref:Uncharacterized protein n=1 Tax=Fagus sylvatica TaxID=28930 RepID=A0A2N9GJD5_FAGSY
MAGNSGNDFGPKCNHSVANATLTGAGNVFLSLEQDSADRRRRILEAQRSAAVDFDVVSRSKHRINDDDDSSDGEGDCVAENGKAEESKKVKAKKPKKPKVTVSDAAAKIDADDLSAFLADITASYQGQQESAVSVGEDVQGVHGGKIRRCE